MSAPYTTNDIATRLGITPGRVRQLALALNLGRKIGRDRLFDAGDVACLQRRNTTSGRPASRPLTTERPDGPV